MKRQLHIVERHIIEYLPLDQIRSDPRNPRAHQDRHIKSLARSIAEFNFNVPVLVDDSGQIVAGHARFEAAKLLCMPEIAVIRLRHLDEPRRRAFMIADNRLHDLSSWNQENISSILLELADADLDFDIELTGFSVAEIDLMQVYDESDPDNEPQLERGPPVSVLGDLWELGQHQVLCASAQVQSTYAVIMADELADVIIADPPYNVPMGGHVTGLGKVKHQPFPEANGEKSEAEFTDFLQKAMGFAAASSRDGSLHYWAMDWRHLLELYSAARATYDEQVNLCVWGKTSPAMGSLYRSQHELFGVWRKGKTTHRNNVQLGRFGRSRSNLWTYPGANSFSRASDRRQPACVASYGKAPGADPGYHSRLHQAGRPRARSLPRKWFGHHCSREDW